MVWNGKNTLKKKNILAFEQFLFLLEIVSIGTVSAITYDAIRSLLKIKVKPISFLDTLIVTQVLSLGAVLVTSNEKEFTLFLTSWMKTGLRENQGLR